MPVLLSILLAATAATLEQWDQAGEVPLAKNTRPAITEVEGAVWIDAEDFADYGGWHIDTQYVHLLGSAYLIAPGVGEPAKDASATIQLAGEASFRVWVRTRDWLPEHHPGQFQVLVNGQPLPKVLGLAEHDKWAWVDAGTASLAKGENAIALHDLTGSFARCDALVLARDRIYVPPDNLEAIRKERARLTGLDLTFQPGGDFEVVVVGGGPAGCPAAIAAARLGAKTALIQDRPVLGGNASLELGVPPEGAGIALPNARESGIIEEVTRIQHAEGHRSTSPAFHRLAEAEPNLTVLLNTRVTGVRMDGAGHIAALETLDTVTGERSVFNAAFAVDCTGDGWVGFYAGAEFRLGREARSEYDEPDAPEIADNITMSGCLMGRHGLSYRAEDTGHAVDYEAPPWAAPIPDLVKLKRRPRNLRTGEWWLEHAGTWDDLDDAERSRDELIRISFGYWDYLKNRWPDRAKLRNCALVHVPFLVAKRETRRLLGDHVLTVSDVLGATLFEDRISYGGWPVDIHNPDGIYKGEGPYHSNYHVKEPYTIPFRCLYSRNIDNLLFAGRCASFSHFALGTVRVERTLATTGQAAGTGAALCAAKGITPRTLCQTHIAELQQALLKYDQYIPEIRNEDPADLARTAHVTASSTAVGQSLGLDDVRLDTKWHRMDHKRAFMMPVAQGSIASVSLYLRSEAAGPTPLRLHVRPAQAPDDFSAREDIAIAETEVPPHHEGWLDFTVDAQLLAPYAWVWLEPANGVSWRLMNTALNGMQRAYASKNAEGPGAWVTPNGYYACVLDPPAMARFDGLPENAVNGRARVNGEESNQWRADPEKPMPQWLDLEFPEPTTFNTVHLTFVTDLDARRHQPAGPGLTAYTIAIPNTNGGWQTLVSQTNNIQRWQRHTFEEVSAKRIRLTLLETTEAKVAGVYEIRVYQK